MKNPHEPKLSKISLQNPIIKLGSKPKKIAPALDKNNPLIRYIKNDAAR